jgi:hypothetical protein
MCHKNTKYKIIIKTKPLKKKKERKIKGVAGHPHLGHWGWLNHLKAGLRVFEPPSRALGVF